MTVEFTDLNGTVTHDPPACIVASEPRTQPRLVLRCKIVYILVSVVHSLTLRLQNVAIGILKLHHAGTLKAASKKGEFLVP
jgi:hypothetical protein